MKDEHTFESLYGARPPQDSVALQSKPSGLWTTRHTALDILTSLKGIAVRSDHYNNKSISYAVALQFMGEEGEYNSSTLFGLKLTASKCPIHGGLKLSANVHVQSGPNSQTVRIFKDFRTTLRRDTSVKRVSAAALQLFYARSVTVELLQEALNAIEVHYATVGVA